MIRFSDFHTTSPEAVDTVYALLDSRRTPFTPFIRAWFAFNGWMSAITGDSRDAEMLDALSNNARLTAAYDNLLNESEEFRDRVSRFSELWPVLNVRSVRKKLGRDAFRRFSPEALWASAVEAGVKIEPEGWREDIRPTWRHVVRTIYQIRCNLFHGEKSPHSIRNRDLVTSADAVLREFITGSRCFTWRDDEL